MLTFVIRWAMFLTCARASFSSFSPFLIWSARPCTALDGNSSTLCFHPVCQTQDHQSFLLKHNTYNYLQSIFDVMLKERRREIKDRAS